MAELTQRDTNARSIRNVLAYTEHVDFPNKVLIDVRNRLDHVAVAWNRFKDAHAALLQTAQANQLQAEIDAHNDMYDATENAYLTAAASLETRLREAAPDNDDNESDNGSVHSVHSSLNGEGNGANNRHNRRINDDEDEEQNNGNHRNDPPVQQQNAQGNVQPIYVQCGSGQQVNYWGEFDGTLTKWRAFHDGFKAAVHNNRAIQPVFKFQYLQKSLKGRALAAFSEWELTADNYAEAWAQLKEMYQLKYQTSQELVFKFLSLPKIEHPTHDNIERLSTVTNAVLRQLRALHYPVQHYDLFIVHCLHQRLDSTLSKDWENERDSDTPTAEQMLAFLNRQAKSRKSVHATEARKRLSNYKHEFDAKRPRPSTSKEHSSPPPMYNRKCKVCKGDHAVHKCSQFVKMNLTERKKSAKEHALCYNCLNPSHSSRDCRAANCKRCDKKHNSLLCSENPFNRAVNVVTQPKSEKKIAKRRNKWVRNQQ